MKVVSVALRRCLPTPHAADHETQAVHNRDEEPYRNSFRRNCAGIVRIDCQDSEDERDAVGPRIAQKYAPEQVERQCNCAGDEEDEREILRQSARCRHEADGPDDKHADDDAVLAVGHIDGIDEARQRDRDQRIGRPRRERPRRKVRPMKGAGQQMRLMICEIVLSKKRMRMRLDGDVDD